MNNQASCFFFDSSRITLGRMKKKILIIRSVNFQQLDKNLGISKSRVSNFEFRTSDFSYLCTQLFFYFFQ